MIVGLHAAGRLPISSAHSMDARKCVHAQKPYSCLAYAHESSKVGGGGKKGRQTGQTDARRLVERKAAQQNKTLPEKLKQSLPSHSSGVESWGRKPPLGTEYNPLPPKSIQCEPAYTEYKIYLVV